MERNKKIQRKSFRTLILGNADGDGPRFRISGGFARNGHHRHALSAKKKSNRRM